MYSCISGRLENLSLFAPPLSPALPLTVTSLDEDEEQDAILATIAFLAAQGGGTHESLALREKIGEGGLMGSMEAYEEKKASLLDVYLRGVAVLALLEDALLLLLLLPSFVLDALDEVDADVVAGQSTVKEGDELLLDVLGLEEEQEEERDVAAVVSCHDQFAFSSDIVYVFVR